MYEFQSKVRYSEVNSEKNLTLPALLNYLQDCCIMQSEDLGVGVEYLKEKHQAWILSSWEIKIKRYPKLGEQIKVSTWPYTFKGFFGFRNFTIEDENGELLAIANSVWVYLDTESMRPVKVTKEMAQAYQFEPQIEEKWAERKIFYPTGGEEKEPFFVQRFHIDTNHHMNNAQYVQVGEAYLPEGFETKRLRVEYRKVALLGEQIFPHIIESDGKWTVVLADQSKQPYAVMEFQNEISQQIV